MQSRFSDRPDKSQNQLRRLGGTERVAKNLNNITSRNVYRLIRRREGDDVRRSGLKVESGDEGAEAPRSDR